MLAHEPGVRLGEDPEELHDMRVATRRLRAALKLYKEVLPKRAERYERDLRHFAGSLGEVRDLDVHLERLAGEASRDGGFWRRSSPPWRSGGPGHGDACWRPSTRAATSASSRASRARCGADAAPRPPVPSWRSPLASFDTVTRRSARALRP